ncbi:hypothetical protein [Sphingobium algorifonticola]|uniref:Uncharacterized protein n=1 Tax=Sphingobium algorifonticola TaxID=2008318 RepID=A0A437JCE9_9SPHN|nr:hypothetical protein [Sphingobium algorifonticola]RVT43561.1 hypothetical protein ENE74_02775 [Sphingobium algorifonticola]
MAGASAEGEVNHWPAFVDVLTTVIMVVTFLLVIMSAAVMVLSQRTLQAFKAQIEAKQNPDSAKNGAKTTLADQTPAPQVKAEAGSSTAELGNILRSETPVNGSEQLTIRTRETPDTLKLQVKAMEEADNTKGVEVKTADVLLRVNFEPMAIRYNDEATQQVVDFLKSRQAPGMKYEIWSFAPQTSSISEAQRLAFYRAAMTRNLLVRAGIKPADIYTQIRVADGASKDGHNVRVVLKP